MKVVLLFCAPMPITFASKLKTEFLLINNFELEYWNLSQIFFSKEEIKKYFKGNTNYQKKYKDELIIKNKKEFINTLQTLLNKDNNFIFWCWDFNNYNDFWIRYLFKKYDIDYFVGPKRTPYKNYLIKQKNFKRFTFIRIRRAIKKRFSLKYYYNSFCLFLFKNTNFFKHPLFVIGSGNLGEFIYKKFFPKSEFLNIPSFDVDWTDLNKNTEEVCVYVDDAIDFGDSKKFTQRENAMFSCTDLDKFYYNLRKFFDKIEKVFNKKVIIAAQGKYFHQNKEKFGNREIFYNKTNNLIKKSKIVIGHESSALWQSLISNKKIILLEDPTFTSLKKVQVECMSVFLNLPIFNITKINENEIIEYYDSYDLNKNNIIVEYFSNNLNSREYKYILLDKLNKIKNEKNK